MNEITGKKTAASSNSSDSELREMEQNFRNSMDNSPLGIRITNEEGDLTYANQAILDIYWYNDFFELKNTPVKKRLSPASYKDYIYRTEQRKKEIIHIMSLQT
ncbi:hypothetical protein ACFLWR_04190 [Chloroflexota bacterium]